MKQLVETVTLLCLLALTRAEHRPCCVSRQAAAKHFTRVPLFPPAALCSRAVCSSHFIDEEAEVWEVK